MDEDFKNYLRWMEEAEEPSYRKAAESDDDNAFDGMAGRVKSLHMINFMCHSNLELTFNRNLNIITGKSESGKTAVLTALMVGLGAKAPATHRGSGLKGFVQKGKTWGRVTVVLINEGTNVYKRAIYGNRITIIRDLPISAYCLKNERGRIVSHCQEEVDSMMATFNIQVDNWICMLKQDSEKAFFSSTDEQLFRMFANGTQLDNLKVMYEKVLKLLNPTETETNDNDEVNNLAANQLEMLVDPERLIEERNNLVKEHVWSLVLAAEQKLSQLNMKMENLLEEEISCKKEQVENDRIAVRAREDVSQTEEEVEELKKIKNAHAEEKTETSRTLLQVQSEITRSEAESKILTFRMGRIMADLMEATDTLRQCTPESKRTAVQKMEINTKRAALEEDLRQVRELLEARRVVFQKAYEDKYNAARTLEDSQRRMDALKKEIADDEAYVRAYESDGEENLNRFAAYTVELRKAIDEYDRNMKFKVKPLGPIGMYVHLTGPSKWAKAVEYAIGKHMNTYCVDNIQDYQVLSGIIDEVCGKDNNNHPRIIITKFVQPRHDIKTTKLTGENALCILDVLEFDNDTIFNVLIDKLMLESTGLFESYNEAARCLSLNQTSVTNLVTAVTMNGDVYFPEPDGRVFFSDPEKTVKYIDNCEAEWQKTVLDLESDLDDKRTHALLKRDRLTRYQKACDEATENVNAIARRMEQLKQEEISILSQIKDLEEAKNTRPKTEIEEFVEEEVETIRTKESETVTRLEIIKIRVEELRERKTELKDRLDNYLDVEKQVSEDLIDTEFKLMQQKEALQDAIMEKAKTDSRMGAISEAIKSTNEDIEELKAALEVKIAEARKICPERIKTEKKPNEIQELLNIMDARLNIVEEEEELEWASGLESELEYESESELGPTGAGAEEREPAVRPFHDSVETSVCLGEKRETAVRPVHDSVETSVWLGEKKETAVRPVHDRVETSVWLGEKRETAVRPLHDSVETSVCLGEKRETAVRPVHDSVETSVCLGEQRETAVRPVHDSVETSVWLGEKKETAVRPVHDSVETSVCLGEQRETAVRPFHDSVETSVCLGEKRETAVRPVHDSVETSQPLDDQNETTTVERPVETLTQVPDSREETLDLFQAHIASLASMHYQCLLQSWGYNGQLNVDFENRFLELSVQPGEDTTSTKDLNTEEKRTHSMMAFILALWKIVDMPIHAIDELNVFTEKFNGTTALDLLLRHATSQTDRQFIFVAPFKTSRAVPSDTVSVIKLSEPDQDDDDDEDNDSSPPPPHPSRFASPSPPPSVPSRFASPSSSPSPSPSPPYPARFASPSFSGSSSSTTVSRTPTPSPPPPPSSSTSSSSLSLLHRPESPLSSPSFLHSTPPSYSPCFTPISSPTLAIPAHPTHPQ